VDLKRILMELGNALVGEYGYLPAACARVDDKSTLPIKVFTDWLNADQDVQEALRRMNVEWSMRRIVL
jgi:hypothetical protein